MNDNEILATEYDNTHKCRYYIYNITEGKRRPFLENDLVADGHPTKINSHYIITDTYPDVEGYQYLKLVNYHSGKIDTIVSAYSTAKHIGEKRCDLHPRYCPESGNVYFDADIDGHRRLYQINIGEVR